MSGWRWGIWLGLAGTLWGAAPPPADWVPARWPWADAASLELLADTPINCLLLKTYDADLLKAVHERGLVPLAIVSGADAAGAARKALAAGAAGIVLEGDFPASAADSVRTAAGSAPVILLTARRNLPVASKFAIVGTYQGVWPGIETEENGAKKAGPTGTIWVDTNTGFLRAARAAVNAPLWISNQPPQNTIITSERYIQAIADADVSGARWVMALDNDFAGRLRHRQVSAVRDWRRIMHFMRYFEAHPEWRGLTEYGKVEVVQNPLRGGILSGGLLDTLATNHMPARPIAPQSLTPAVLRGATLVVDLEPNGLTDAQENVLRDFAAAGGKVLKAPPRWQDPDPSGGRITLTTHEFDRLDRLWNDLNAAMPRRSYGVSLFNAATMISNVLTSADGKALIVHLVNYSDYPVEGISVAFPTDYTKATLLMPEGAPQNLAVAPGGGGAMVTLDKLTVCATIQLER